MTKIRFDWRTDDGILLHVDANVTTDGELVEYDVILKQHGDDISFIDYLSGSQQDDITQACWNEYTQYIDDRRARV